MVVSSAQLRVTACRFSVLRLRGYGTDISVAALRMARANAVGLGLADRATFIACNYAAALDGPFDLIVSNPP